MTEELNTLLNTLIAKLRALNKSILNVESSKTPKAPKAKGGLDELSAISKGLTKKIKRAQTPDDMARVAAQGKQQTAELSRRTHNYLDEFDAYISEISNDFIAQQEALSRKIEYTGMQGFLADEEDEILEEMRKSKNPEEIFMQLDTKFFKDFGFIADAIEVCGKRQSILIKSLATKQFDELKKAGFGKDGKSKISKKEWINKQVGSREEAFAKRIQAKCDKEFAILKEQEEKEDQERQERIEQEKRARDARIAKKKSDGRGGLDGE